LRIPRPVHMFLCGVAFAANLLAFAGCALAGAWLEPTGSGQIIAGAAFSGSCRAFNANGRLIPVPSYDKFELGAYVEYGLTDWMTLIATPAYDRIRQPAPAQSYSGAGESGIGGRVGLYRSDAAVASVEAVVRTPGPSLNGGLGLFQPRRAGSIDMRIMLGHNFEIAGFPGFADAQAGYRFYAQNQPGEWHIDLTLGLRPTQRVLALIQSFSSVSNGSGQGFVRSSWHKLQTSLVYELSPAWSAQFGAFLTVAGVNAGREFGPLGALWYRF
jgi:hypothetical protein